MIHDISPRKMFNEFRQQLPIASDYLMFFENEKVLLKKTGTSFALPTFEDVAVCNEGLFPLSHYLFSIDDRAFFLTESKPSELNDDFVMQPQNEFRHFPAPELGFAGASASHLWRWERSNKFCGCCGTKLDRSKTERAFCCPQCGHCVYPRIAPVVIVAVSAGSRLLMVRNKNNLIPKRFLVSGFVDIGENLEQAAAREVFEETGLRIKNIRYVTSQPWGFSDSLIAGFTAELDGDDSIHIQESELAEALWVERENIPEYDTNVSISGVLIEMFRKKTDVLSHD